MLEKSAFEIELEKDLELLLSGLKELKELDGKFIEVSDHEKLVSFLNLKFGTATISDNNISRLNNRANNSDTILTVYDVCVGMVINKIMQSRPKETKNFNCISILTMLRNKVEPNYNLVPKIYCTIPKVGAIHDLIFGIHQTQLKLIHLVEYFRQREFSFDDFIKFIIMIKAIEFFDAYEPKTNEWYVGFIETGKNNTYVQNINILLTMIGNT